MATTSKVIAKKRDRAGKGGARSSRRDGLIPAVIYGDKQPPMMIAVEPKSVEREMHKEGFFNHQLKIEVDGQGFDVLPRDVIASKLTVPNAERIFFVRHALRAGFSVDEIFNLTKIDRWFLTQIKEIVDLEEELARTKARRKDRLSPSSCLRVFV